MIVVHMFVTIIITTGLLPYVVEEKLPYDDKEMPQLLQIT
jgi:hypothetical protein